MKTQGTRCNSPQTSMFTLFHLFSFPSCFLPLYPPPPDAHISHLTSHISPPCFFFPTGIRHLIVMGVEAGEEKKKKKTRKHSIVIVQSQNSRLEHMHTGIRMSLQGGGGGRWRGQKLSVGSCVCACLCVCKCMFLAGEGGTSSFLAALSLALSLQGLNRLPFWAPTTANAADPPLPRSSSSLCYCSSLSSFA